MKHKIAGILLPAILFYNTALAQGNLVPNGGFENYSICPGSAGKINYALPWFQPNYPYAGPGGSSDFYNSCNYPSIPNVPWNGTYQFPKNGNGYAAINLFHDTSSAFIDKDREYIEVGLTDSLKAGKHYCIRFFTNKGNWSSYAVKNIQAVLTNDSLLYYDSNYSYITGVTPVLEAPAIITDTLNWTAVEITYIANGGERFLTIGNFNSGATTAYQYVWPYGGSPNTLGYYLIDDVSIYMQPDIDAGADTLIPPGSSVQLGISGRPDISYSWAPSTGLSDPNIANPIATPGVSTTYTLTVTDTNSLACTSSFTDSVNVFVGYAGIEQYSFNQASLIYPNPARQSCTFLKVLKPAESGSLMICDLKGELISSYKLNAGPNKIIIDLSGWSNGIYLYKIVINGEISDYKKLVIAR